MSSSNGANGGPQGGLAVKPKVVRRWRWSEEGDLLSAPIRCKREQWYLAQAFPAAEANGHTPDVLLRFLEDDQTVAEYRVGLSAMPEDAASPTLLGWIQSPENVTHMQIHVPNGRQAGLQQLLLHPIAERDPKCHPLANVPRWTEYKTPFPVERIVLPAALESLAELIDGVEVEIVKTPRSVRKLAAHAIGAACILDPQWIRELGVTLSDIERIAAGSWMILDLATFTELLNASGEATVKLVTRSSENEIMSARVEYADVPTRGFAMQDVFPYSIVRDGSTFETRVLQKTGAWKTYARRTDFASILTSETPWENRCGDILCAMRAFDLGELIVSDVPWLAAGELGPSLAPELTRHLLRAMLDMPVSDTVQYWNHWDDCAVLVRDLSETPKRYPPVRTVRWADESPELAHLGLALPAESEPAQRVLMINSGRIDRCGAHDGVPPEPMAIFMKWLTRERREDTRWARRHLADTTVIWQFDTSDGLKYATQFDSAAWLGEANMTSLAVRAASGGQFATERGSSVLEVPYDVGIHGDRSLAFQAELTVRLRKWIERAGR